MQRGLDCGGLVLENDEALYRRVRAGDEAALDKLITRYHEPLFKFLYRMTDDPTLAEDLLQETFTRLITYRGRAPDRFRAWLYAIAANLARDHFRSAYYRHTSTDGVDGLDVQASSIAEDAFLRSAQREHIAQALQQLTAEQREVVVLRFYHDLRLEEIALISNAPIGTVKSRLFYALKRLKTLLAVAEAQR